MSLNRLKHCKELDRLMNEFNLGSIIFYKKAA